LLLVGLVVLYLGAVLVLPLSAILGQALAAGPAALAAAFDDPGSVRGLGLSLVLAVIALLANGLLGVAGALVLTRHRFLGRRLLDALVDLPLAVSPVMTGLAFLLVFGREGWLEPALDAAGWKVTFAFPGLVLATLFVTFPFTLREVGYVLEELGTDEEEAAATLGASPWQTFWRVTLPNVRYGLGYGVVLTVARALGEFGAVLVLGGAISGHTETATTFIYNALEERQESAAYAMAMVLALASVALLVALEWLKRQRGKER
jgi:sulfate transport system permease protein